MTEEMLAQRVRAAIEAFHVPAYPPNTTTSARLTAVQLVRPRHHRAFVYAAIATCALAIFATSAAFAVPPAFSDRVIRAFESVGVHLRGAQVRSLDSREVSLEEARAAADFAVVVPVDIRLVKTLLTNDAARHHVFVTLVFEDDRRNQLVLSEERVNPRHPPSHFPAFRINNDGSVRRLPPAIAWRLGDTQLQLNPYGTASQALAERIRRATFVSGKSSR